MAVADTTAEREALLQLLQQGHNHQFIDRASKYLIACPGDSPLALLVAREYLNLGLVGPARELMTSDYSHQSGSQAELSEVANALSDLPDGQIPWSQRSDLFEKNISALCDRDYDVSEIVDRWHHRQNDFQLYQDRGRVDQIRMRFSENIWAWIPFFGHHKLVSDAQELPEDITTLCPGPYLFDGLDLGHFFGRIYGKTVDTFLGYSCPLYVVEPDAALLALVLHLHDWSNILADPRIFIFTGANGTNELRKLWDNNPDLPLPTQVRTLSQYSPRSNPSAVQTTEQALASREKTVTESLADLNGRYNKFDLAYWSNRFEQALNSTGEPLRILAGVSVHTTFLQYSMRDTKRAIESLGHRCMVLQESSNHETIGPITYHNAIREFRPDVFLSLDHMRPEFGSIIPRGLPVLTWDQDQLPHVFTDEIMRRVSKHDFLVGYSKDRWVFAGCEPKQFLNARVPTCPKQFDGQPLTPDEIAKYSCDLSYVSHASQTPQQFHDEERRQYQDPNVQALLDCIYACTPEILAKYSTMHSESPYEILEQAQQRSGITIRDDALHQRIVSWYLWRLRDRIYRHDALAWAATWAKKNNREFRIYGRGWDAHPTLSPFAAGLAENGRELLCIYRASKINLQLMPAGFIHQRALDGLAAGGFFLTRLAPDDLKGATLHKLCQHIQSLGINTTEKLFGHQDAHLRKLLATYFDLPLGTLPRVTVPLSTLQHRIEVPYPDEVFPRFREIIFDSPDSFAQVANRFIEDNDARQQLTQAFREVVIDQFSYRASVSTFLNAMANYLRSVAS